MKKLLFISASFCLMLAACNNKKDAGGGGMSDRAKKNLDATRVVSKAFESGDASGIDAVVADNFVDHTPMGDMNRDSLKSMIVKMHKADATMKMETIQEFANDDYAATWYRFTGTSDGSMGMPKGPYDMHAIELVKFNNDSKAIEHWEYMDTKEMMTMMGGQKPPMDNNNMGKDTTHM